MIPGCAVETWRWLVPGEQLLVSGRVWDVKALAASLGTQVDTKCWPVILCRRQGDNRLANCDKQTQGPGGAPTPGHKSMADAAHTLRGLDLETAASNYARAATAAEAASVRRLIAPSTTPAPRGAASSRGAGSSRGRGRSRATRT